MGIVYKIFFALRRSQKRRLENGKQPSKFSKKITDYCEWYYNIPLRRMWEKHPLKRTGINKKTRDEKIIVSLTSYPKRIDTVHLVIESLLRQSMKPDAVILWLAESQFDGIDSLPPALLRLREHGLTIRFCDDLRSHKKYFYAMQEYPNDLIVLADDDMFYPRDMIAKLIKLHEKFPSDICCSTCQAMNSDNLPSQWRNPGLNERFEHSMNAQVYTGSGSLFPPHAVPKDAFDRDNIMTLAPHADDLWLTYTAHKNGTAMTALHPWRAFPIEIYGASSCSLWYINGQDGQNDVQWQAIRNYFEKKEH